MLNYHGLTEMTPTIPKFYCDVETQEQRIKLMCRLIQDLLDNETDFTAEIANLKKAVSDAITECKSYTDDEIAELRDELMMLIDQLIVGQLTWDVTVGGYKSTVDAARDTFNDVTVHGITVDKLASLDYDVDTLTDCGLTVRGLALFGGYLLEDTFIPEGIFYADAPIDQKRLTCALLAGAGVLNGYFVTGDLADKKATVRKLSTAKVENDYIKE